MFEWSLCSWNHDGCCNNVSTAWHRRPRLVLATGDPVVVYTSIQTELFSRLKELVIDGFGDAMTEHRGNRLTFSS